MNAGHVIAVNSGSSTVKLAVFPHDVAPEAGAVLRMTIERKTGSRAVVTGDAALMADLSLPDGEDAAACVMALAARLPVRALVHRIVHGGDDTRECFRLDDAERARLQALAPLAPLHQPAALAIVDAIAAAHPSLAQYACPDTAFHATLPPVARTYALPADIRARHPELHGYGFHGLSCRSIVDRLARGGELPARLVIAHLGSGASVTAVRDGASVATSMGFSALDGLVMATRPGRIDAGALLYLLRHETSDIDRLESMLYRESGLLGLSGCSGDMRTLLASGDPAARAAVDFFVYRAAQEIAALAVALGGIDGLVFTGGIGEHQPVIRDRIVDRLGCLNGPLQARVIPCDEEAAMAAAVRRLESRRQ